MTARLVPLTEISRPKQWRTLSQSELSKTGFPVYGANGKIGFYGEYNHEEPTLLIGCRGSCGCINVSEPKAWINGNAMCLDNLDPGVELRYLYHFLRSYDFSKVISGTSQPQITFKGLTKVNVPVPPTLKQKQIARGLDGICELKKNAEDRLAKLDVLAKALFVEMFGDPISNPRAFPLCPFVEALHDETKLGTKYPTEEYLPAGQHPIIAQGQGEIAGYRNDDTGLYKRVPVIVFGDHTCCLKLVSSPFFLGADGTKILHPERSRFNIHYLFRCLHFCRLPDTGYSRHFKWLKEFSIPEPPLHLQCTFAKRVERIDKLKADLRETIGRLDILYRAKLQEYFG